MRFLVTAGPSREMIDRVRQWGNIFTGTTGLNIAQALTALGLVDLVTSNHQHVEQLRLSASQPQSLYPQPYTTHEELRGILATLMARQHYSAVFMTAAVADYRPAGVFRVLKRESQPEHQRQERWLVEFVQAPKVKSSYGGIAILGEPTAKLIDLFRNDWGYQGLLVKFKLEVDIPVAELLRIGEESRQRSQADFLVANTLAMTSGPEAGAYLLGSSQPEWVPRADLPARLVQLVRDHSAG
ncbi:MAG: hypothetical protein HJJLKODD_01898 [Phycisphaerae bacterium]|nr:hypothetical protein [Phycisphaerae bacterium]